MSTVCVVAVLALGTFAACGDSEDESAPGDQSSPSATSSGSDSSGSDSSAPEVTGTITLDGAPVEPLDRLMCGELSGEATIQGMVGDNRISLGQDSASYSMEDTTWSSTSGDDRGSLDVSLEGASGTLKMYEDGTAQNSADQVFVDLVVDITCADQG